MSSPNRPPFDDVRAAFERLATPDKAAFVFEATFETIGQAISETGRRVSDAVSSLDLDALFRMDGMDPSETAPPSAAAPSPSSRKKAAPKKASRPTRPGADPSLPPTDDGPAAL